MRELPKVKLDLNTPEKFGNVAEKLTVDQRRTLAEDLIQLIGIDDTSMSDWSGEAQGYLDDMEKSGNDQPQDREQEGANEEPPPVTEMTLTAVVQFSARATDALLGEPDLIKASETGEGPVKLAEWISSQFRTKDPNWILDTDPLVVHMSVTGLAWRKRDFDDDDKVFHSHFIPSVGSNRVIINANVRAVERAPRITHEFERFPYEIERSIERGKWVDYDPKYDERDPQAPKRFFECDAWLDLDGDSYDEPWTVVISRDDSPEVVRIRPRWSRKTVVSDANTLFFNPLRRFYPYRFLPDPKGGFFPMGFGKLLDRIQNASDQLLGSIVDTAKTEAENGGIAGGSQYGLPDKIEVKGNRITTIPTDGQKLSDILQMFPGKSVSAGSVAVLEKLITLGDRVAGTLNTLENAPASMTATLAKGLIDNGQQVQSAVHRRMCESLTQEAHMFVEMANAYDMLPEGVQLSDADGIAVTADPQLATEMARSAMGGLYMQMIDAGAKVPGSFNVREAAMRFVQVMRLPDPEKLIAAPPQGPEATPYEKMQGMLGMMKNQNDKIKILGGLAVQLTQSVKNLTDARGGLIDNRAALLQMAQLEQVVQELLTGNNANGGLNGLAGPAGNPSPDSLPASQESGDSGAVPSGDASAAGAAGPGGGTVQP